MIIIAGNIKNINNPAAESGTVLKLVTQQTY